MKKIKQLLSVLGPGIFAIGYTIGTGIQLLLTCVLTGVARGVRYACSRIEFTVCCFNQDGAVIGLFLGRTWHVPLTKNFSFSASGQRVVTTGQITANDFTAEAWFKLSSYIS